MDIHVHAAWLGILAGLLAGVVQGLFFHRDDWQGGYASWPRRMVRLGHVSFFGIGFMNLAFAASVQLFEFAQPVVLTSWLLLAGAFSMPTVCYLSAWRKPMRHLFAVPVLCLVVGVLWFLFAGMR